VKRYKKDINPANNRFEVPMTWQGRACKLVKRDQSPDAPWYLRKAHKGRDYWRSTGTNEAELAQNKAKTLLGAIFNQDTAWLDSTKLRDPVKYATVDQVCPIYEQCSTVVRPRGPVNTLRSILRNVYGQDTDVGKLTMDKLTSKVVADYQSNVVKAVREQDLSTDEHREALRRAQRTANSTWNQARCLFVPAMMAQYRNAGLHFPPNFEVDFFKAPKIKGKAVKQPMYVQPPDAVVHRTLEAHRRLMESVARRNFPAGFQAQRAAMVCLELGAGLRNAEVTAARGSWFGEVNGTFCIMLPSSITKDLQAAHKRLPADFEQYIRSYMQHRKIGPDSRLIPAGERITRAVSRWMRRLGWEGTKTNHALRALFGYRIMVKYGIAVAQSELRHKQIATTQTYYTGVLAQRDVVVTFDEPPKVIPLPTPTAEDPKVVALPASSP
jgi:integrase